MKTEIKRMKHSKNTNINLDHLTAFVTVCESGGVNIAAQKLFKSPSTISHALSKLQTQLALTLFKQIGRKLHLTEQGEAVLKQAKILLDEKQNLLNIADHLRQGRKSEIVLAVDTIFPHDLLLAALSDFVERFPLCHIKLHEAVLSGAEEQLVSGQADICVAYRIPQGFLGEKIIDIPFVPVVSPAHPLAQQSSISSRSLTAQRQVVISDSGHQDKVDSGWLKSVQRWTVSNMYTAIEVIRSGMAFGWIPEHLIKQELESELLVPLQFAFGGEKTSALFISLADEQCVMSAAFSQMLKHRSGIGARYPAIA